RVADDLSRLVESHRLAIEQGAGEHLGVKAFDPGRYVDQQRKTGGVALRKAVGSEPFDLTKTTFGKVALKAVGGHAVDKFPAKFLDVAVAPEGGHRAAQLVGFVRSKSGAIDGDLHRLFLEERHPFGLAQDVLQPG